MTRKQTSISRCVNVIIITTLAAIVAGCGGGGGGASGVTSSSENRSPAGGAITRSIKLNSFATWGAGVTSQPLSEYQLRLENTTKRDYTMIGESIGWWNQKPGWVGFTPTSYKAINPNIKVYRYYTISSKQMDNDTDCVGSLDDTRYMTSPLSLRQIQDNDWWLRDGNGEIITQYRNGAVKFRYLDVGKPGLKEAYLQAAIERNAGLGFDGFVFDVWIPAISELDGASYPMPVAYPTNEDWFQNAWRPFLQYVTDGLRDAGYRVIGNCAGGFAATQSEYQFQRSVVDGTVYERFILNWDGNWRDGASVERAMYSASNEPIETWIVEGSLKTTTPEYDQKRKASLAAYYMSIPMSQTLHSYNHPGTGESSFWDPLWDFNIGTPVQSADKKTDQYAWSRDYSEGKVLLNYELGTSVTFTLNRRYVDIDGNTYSGSVTLPPRTGLILQKV